MQAVLKKQWVLFCYALSFFSRVPTPRSIDFKAFPFHLGNSYFPLVGTLSAIISFAVYYIAQYFFDNTISVILMLMASLFFTGGFHEDGFADTCDGFGGGYTKTQCLAIMKDSQIGTYGVLGLIILFALKINLLNNLSLQSNFLFLGILISSSMLSRLSILGLMQYSQYARNDATSKAANSAHRLPINYLVIALLPCLLSLYWMPILWCGIIFSIIIVSTLLCRLYFHKMIEGYTGDCLGFLQQFNELLILLALVPLFQYCSPV